MENLTNTPAKPVLLALLFIFAFFAAAAQSPVSLKTDSGAILKGDALKEVAISTKRAELPETQQISLRAPAKVKIDGNANDWNNNFHAYNHATNIFYLIANDDDNLYLVIQATEPNAANKIVGGGITFTVQRSLEKKVKDAASITYPFYQIPKGDVGVMFDLTAPNDTATKDAQATRNNHNLQLGHLCKWLRITGVPGFDTLTSVYNDEGILATGVFDLREHYTFELRIPLKSLSLSATDETKFAYHIQLNGANTYGPDPVPDWPGPPILTMRPIGLETMGRRSSGRTSPVPPRHGLRAGPRQSVPTDFWAEYTLAKKQP